MMLIAVIVLGIGYAASTGKITINGNATVTGTTNDFSIKITDVTPTEGSLVTGAIVNDETATITASLTNINDSGTVTFKITNNSPKGIKAVLNEDDVYIYKKGTTQNYSSDYFNVTYDVDQALEILSGQTADITVTVTLKKVYVPTAQNPSMTEEFDIILDAYVPTQE